MRRCERGFTLLEIAIAAGIAASLALAGIAAALASRPAALAAATAGVDALLDAARTAARAAPNGARLTFAPLAGDPSGVRVDVAGEGLAFAPLETHVAIAETELLGAPSFALALHADGAVGGVAGAGVELGCPPSGAFHLVFSAAGRRAERFVSCRAATAPGGATFVLPPAGATPSPPAQTCAGGPCSSVVAPPNAAGVCPPGFFFIGPTACADPPLLLSPSSLLFLAPGAPAQSVAAHEDGYTGPLVAGASTCGGAIALSGGGNGTDATFSVAPLAPARCSVQIADDHGGASTFGIVTYGRLVVTPARLTFSAPDAPAASLAVSEAAYAGTIAVDGCNGYATASPSSFALALDATSTIAVTPAQVTSCTLNVRDDHGGVVPVSVVVNAPATSRVVCASDPRAGTTDTSTIPWTTYVGVSSSPPCPAPLVAATAGSVGWTFEPATCDVASANGCATGQVRNVWQPFGVFVTLSPLVAPSAPASALGVTLANVVDGGTGGVSARVSASPFAPDGTTAGPQLAGRWDGTRFLFWSAAAAPGPYYVALLPAGSPPAPAKSGIDVTTTFTYAIAQFP